MILAPAYSGWSDELNNHQTQAEVTCIGILID